jgi:hypothetical protein
MTIKPGETWGRQVARPDRLLTVDGDHALAQALADSERAVPVAARSGDLARTLGVTSHEPRAVMNVFPVDLLEVRLDGTGHPQFACAHVVVRSPWSRGHWWRGPILAVMNAEFLGEWDVAPRGHPNDGRVEVFDVDATMSVRDRLAARRRLRLGTHVPHPHVRTRSVRAATWHFPRTLQVIVDGRPVGRASTITVTVVPDAAIVYA